MAFLVHKKSLKMMSPDKYDNFVEAAKVATYYEHKLHNGERIAKDIRKVTP